MIYNNILDMIGNTPILRLKNIEDKFNLGKNIELYGKVEKNNPAGSIKDRAVKQIILDLFKEGKLKEGSTIIEPTSGNTGIAMASIGRYLKLNVIIVMPSSMSEERRKLIRDYGARLELVDGGMDAAVKRAEQLNKKIPDSVIPGQFINKSNVDAHYLTTAPEIFKDIPDINYIFAGIGTGGTITGIGKYVIDNDKNTQVIGVEPESSPLLTKGKAAAHKIQGIGANFIPEILDLNVVSKIIDVSNENAINTAREICFNEGLLVGISSGASVYAAIDLYRNLTKKDSKIKMLCILPDTGERYSWN
ncbi:cysteine synthase family protein [Brachyspira hyodysenteriae]|uniref:PLP-dependent cysteine synthase family protein n=1 Tax=Brachyspira hyodysenteriae TaxID=159 RepID=UPI0022CD9C20|nr:cysteine synthase family protein [Brachyspira hyodysenteriae]MCZ9840123.1 cysteine synthase family protein [Brachyspira hyodysenteriae]MCZ9848523.1 cysteine synthase family protein [Brachyspira hyodysenteriae]MCZ9871874.1 cysteine synthase family protein [Brachyspira hyodysenteriae]MCZ9875375.1 cysteine synthase family protein [Brachyspira hyodysenteriae]MCZ9891012.1 cysteine synthase family protein [Brachyspira hyodysenteriae]